MVEVIEKTSTNLTEKEKQFLEVVLKNAYEQCGMETVEGLLDDNYSWFTHKDFKDIFTPKQFSGLVSSLSEKCVITANRDGMYISYSWLEKQEVQLKTI